MNPQVTGGGATLLPELKSRGEAEELTYLNALKTMKDWAIQTESANSAASSTTQGVAQRGSKQEAAFDDQTKNLVSSMRDRSSSTAGKRAGVGVGQQEQALLVKKVAKPKGKLRSGSSTRWETHNKLSCKCAVCCTYRGEQKSSWYKHYRSTCQCAVCKQSRREPRPIEAPFTTSTGEVEGGGLSTRHSLPTIPGKRASWVPLELTKNECSACLREFPRYGGGGPFQAPSPLSTQPQSSFLNSNAASPPPVRVESCNTTTGMPMSLQKLNSLAGRAADFSGSRISPVSRSPLPSAQKCTFEAQHERFTCERRFEFSCCAENSNAEQQAVQSKLLSNARCSSGWPNSYPATCSKSVTRNSSDGVQQCRKDSLDMQQSWENLAAMSSYWRAGLSWQNNVDMRQDEAGTSIGLHDAYSPLFVETMKLNAPRTLNTREPVKETSPSTFSTVTERNGQGSRHSNSENMIKTGSNAAASLPDPCLSPGKTTSFFGGLPSSVAHVQHTLAPNSGLSQEMDYHPVYVRLQGSNSLPHILSGRPSSVAQFPFGLEVQAQAEHDVYHRVGDLQAEIHARSIPFDCDKGNTQSSPSACTTSTTSMVQDKDDSCHATDVDSGFTVPSSRAITQEGLERQLLLSGVDSGDPARSGCDKVRLAKPGGQKFSKCLANPDDGLSTLHQKRTKREGSSHPIPKWCQLIDPKYDHPSITWKMYRPRVPKTFHSSSRALDPTPVKSKENGSSGSPLLSEQGNKLERRSRLEESITSNGLQITDSTGARESTVIKAARRDASVVPEENTLLRESSQESPRTKKIFVTSPAAEVKVYPMGETIGRLNMYRTIPERFGLDSAPVVQCEEDSNDESEAREREVFPSRIESVSLPCGQDISRTDISNVTGKARRTTICAINGHLGKTVQRTDPPTQNVVAKVGIGCPGRKRSRTELETCSERRQSRLDPSRLLIPQLEDTCLLQPLKKHNKGQRHHGVSVGTSSPRSIVKSLFEVGPARGTNSNGQIMKLTVKVVLPESTKVYYLTRMLKVWTPELTVWVTELVRDMTHQSPSTLMVHSHLVPKGNSSSCSTPHMLLEALKSFLCQKTTDLVTCSDLEGGRSIHCASNIGEGKENSNEHRTFCTRSRLDDELRSFWHAHYPRSGFLRLPHDRRTVYIEDLIVYEVCDRMLKESSGSSNGMRSQRHSSFCGSAPNAVNDWAISGRTQAQRGGMTDIHQHQQRLTHEVQSTALRNIVLTYWIDKPLHGLIRLAFPPCILLKWSPPRLLLCGEEGYPCTTSSEQGQTAERHCELVPSRCCPSDSMEDNCNGEAQHGGQISSDGVILEGIPVNAVQPMEHYEIPGSSEFHGEGTDATETRPVHTPCGSSFQDLLKSVLRADNIVSSPLQKSLESKIDLKEELRQISSNECPTSIPELDFWESLLNPRNDGPASASCSSDSLSKPIRRRGCPKGGWPKKNTDKKNLYEFSAANMDSVESHGTTSQNVPDAEVDFEVVQSTNTRISNRQDSEFKKKLGSFLDRPFQLQELSDLEEHACLRKPLLRHRETRQRVLLVATAKDGMSYLDYHPDLARKLADAGTPEERLKLLRGFFFWIQHSCTSGSFKPWAPNVDEAENSDDDCVEIFPQERVQNHVHTIASTTKAEVESRPVKCEQTSARTANGMHMMTLRTRGQKRKSASQPNRSKYLWKQMKPSVETRVKRERK